MNAHIHPLVSSYIYLFQYVDVQGQPGSGPEVAELSSDDAMERRSVVISSNMETW